MPNPYHSPEDLGLHIVAEAEPHERNYDFAITLFLGDAFGGLWYGYDAGCSCPSPFEETRFPDDFERIHTVERLNMLEAEYSPDAAKSNEWRDCFHNARAFLAKGGK